MSFFPRQEERAEPTSRLESPDNFLSFLRNHEVCECLRPRVVHAGPPGRIHLHHVIDIQQLGIAFKQGIEPRVLFSDERSRSEYNLSAVTFSVCPIPSPSDGTMVLRIHSGGLPQLHLRHGYRTVAARIKSAFVGRCC